MKGGRTSSWWWEIMELEDEIEKNQFLVFVEKNDNDCFAP
jgi:hypothetical protein